MLIYNKAVYNVTNLKMFPSYILQHFVLIYVQLCTLYTIKYSIKNFVQTKYTDDCNVLFKL